jgi:AI-2 transport system ATP-binding protein
MDQEQNVLASGAMIAVNGIQKSFGTNRVLKGVRMDVNPGEVMALIGGNGAGKSTLVKIIMGIYQPDDGVIRIKGIPVRLSRPSVALAHGIYLVPQEPMLFPNMTVEENIIMGFTVKKSELRRQLSLLMDQLGWFMDLTRKAASLSIAEQQLVELLRGLMRNANILILDEPTSSLTFNEVKSLFQIIRKLKKQNISIIYITHRLTEVFDIADRVTIMRDGVITLCEPVGEVTREILVRGLLPADAKVASPVRRSICAQDAGCKVEPVLRVDKLTGFGFSDVSFEVYPGEILGLAGVVGAGRTELATTIFGKDIVKSGKVYLQGQDITGMSTSEVMSKGLNYVTEDRFLNGIFRISDVAVNTTAACMDMIGRFFLNTREERKITDRFIQSFRTKVTGRDQVMGSLSGGNQQKVVIARSLSTQPKLLILDEPTRGIDAAARGDVYAIINDLREQGLAILMISSDMEEIVELSDRTITMYCGHINRSFERKDINQDRLMAAAFGVTEGVADYE